MSPRRTVRRDRDGAGKPPRSEQVPEPTVEPARSAVAGPTMLDLPVARLAEDDLLALADMDPGELASLMEGNLRSTRIDVGQKVTGTVARVGADDVFVDIGGKSEGRIDRVEVPEVRVGEALTAYVLQTGEHGITLSLRLSGSAAAEHIEEARESGIPVDGTVVARNAGGFEVRLGGVRAFCPVSLISRLPSVDLDSFVGQTLQFRVVETGDKVVVNRRVIQEEEIAERAEDLWRKLAVGQEYGGVVRNVQSFGAFVDIGGVDGLVPRREQSWVGESLTPGDAVEVVVLQVDHAARRLTLSARRPADDPWHLVGTVVSAGGIYQGKVASLTSFGAFVALGPGLQGLIHVSKLAAGVPEVGAELTVRVISVDHERRRIELAPAVDGEVATAGGEVRGVVAQVVKNGVVVQLSDGRTGWLAAREVELPAGTVLAQRFRVGKPVVARVLGEEGERVTLSLRSDADAAEGAWQTAKASRTDAGSTGGFGTLGDLLGKLKIDR